MRVIRPHTLASFRGSGKCDICRHNCQMTVAHHIIPRGRCRLDITINLAKVAFEPFGSCKCHRRHHDVGIPTTDQFIDAVAKREGFSADAIKDTLAILQQLPKRPSQWDIDLRVGELEVESYVLANWVIEDLRKGGEIP